jgi:hypothetical protein
MNGKEKGRKKHRTLADLLFIFASSLTCKTNKEAQARVAMISRMEPLNQSLSVVPVVSVT